MTRCVITCLEPGCSNQIHYDSDDGVAPLYCTVHRTLEGRHSEVRVVNPKKKKPIVEKVELVCVRKSCRKTMEIDKKEWVGGVMMGGMVRVCPACGRMMVYNRDVK
jgi:hypothetical protein